MAAASLQTQPGVDDAMLDGMVEPDPVQGRSRARLVDAGTPVWAIISNMGEPTTENIARVAESYRISDLEMRAVLRFYERNRAYIDAFILLNNEWFENPWSE